MARGSLGVLLSACVFGVVSGPAAMAGSCPGSGDCCSANGTPGCEQALCCNIICAADPFCCDTEWDQICADAAQKDCGICENCPGSGDCCQENGTPGCLNGRCCVAICAVDPFCCDTEWDSFCVDAAVKESACDCGPAALPDLQAAISADGSVWEWGDDVTVDLTISNEGQGPADASLARIVLSSDFIIGDGDDVILDTEAVPGLAVGAVWTKNNHLVSLPNDPPSGFPGSGTVWVGLIADVGQDVPESNENNNNSLGDPVDITGPILLPDLRATITVDETTVQWGEDVTTDIFIENIGDGDAKGSIAKVVLSSDSTIGDGDDYQLGLLITQSTPAGQGFFYAPPPWSLPPDPPAGFPGSGTVWVGVIADHNDLIVESDENNNDDADTVNITVLPGSATVSVFEFGPGPLVSTTELNSLELWRWNGSDWEYEDNISNPTNPDTFGNLDPLAEYRIDAYVNDMRLNEDWQFTAQGDLDGDIVAEEPATFIVSVVDSDGFPVIGAEVALVSQEGTVWRSGTTILTGEVLWSDGEFEASVQAAQLPGETWTIQVAVDDEITSDGPYAGMEDGQLVQATVEVKGTPTVGPTLTAATILGSPQTVDRDGDGYSSQVGVEWTTSNDGASIPVYALISAIDDDDVEFVLGSDTYVAPMGTTTRDWIVNVSADTSFERGEFHFRIRLYDLATDELLDTIDQSEAPTFGDVGLEPGGDGTMLPNGKWTIICHGLSNTSYASLVEPVAGNPGSANWMYRLGEMIARQSSPTGVLSASNVAIHTMNHQTFAIEPSINGGVSPEHPEYHHVLLFDWVGVSNFYDKSDVSGSLPDWVIPFVQDPPAGVTDDDGYAEGAADALYALVHRHGIESSVHAFIGYSRGSVVASEFVQRMILTPGAAAPAQVIKLDPEGGHFGGLLYEAISDSKFFAWDGVDTTNYWQVNHPFHIAPCDQNCGLEGEAVPGARNFELDSAAEDRWYGHSRAWEYLITGHPLSCIDEDICSPWEDDGYTNPTGRSGLYVQNEILTTQDTPDEPSGATGDPCDEDPPALFASDGISEIFNGDFDGPYAGSTAGWYYHGGTEANQSNSGTVVNGRLKLDAGQERTHNWAYVPAAATSLVFDVIGQTEVPMTLRVFWSTDMSTGAEFFTQSGLGSGGVTFEAPLPPGMAGSVVRVRFETDATPGAGNLQIDNITWSDALPSPSVDLVVSPSLISVTPKSNVGLDVTLLRTNYDGPVDLDVAGLPEGVTAQFTPDMPDGDTAELALTIAGDAAPGTYLVDVTGVADGVEITSAPLTLIIDEVPDLTPPTQQFAAGAVVEGAGDQTVVMTYTDNVAVSLRTLGGDDLIVSKDGCFQTLALDSVVPFEDAPELVATYSFLPPGGTWDAADNGTYTVELQADAVTDVSGNAIPGGVVGFIEVDIIDTPDVELVALTFTPSTVEGGTTTTGEVTLSAPAPRGGATILLSTRNPAVVVPPTRITVPEGDTDASFTVNTAPVETPDVVTVFADWNGDQISADILVTPTMNQLFALVFTPSTVEGGTSTTGEVTLAAPAPRGGASVLLSSSNPAVVMPPSQVTIPEGDVESTFTVTTASVEAPEAVTVFADWNGDQVSAAIIVNPTTPLPDSGWINSLGGVFGVAANWAEGQVPGPQDTALFGLNAIYTVTAQTDHDADRLLVTKGEPRLDLAPHVLTLGPGNYDLEVTAQSGDTARLILASGEIVSASQGSIADTGSTTGEIVLTGAEAVWRVLTNGTNVGREGTGSLRVEDGAAWIAPGVTIATHPGSQGVVTVSGSGSSWTQETSQANRIGARGLGRLEVLDGGLAQMMGDTTLGTETSAAEGEVLVSGSGSALSSTGPITIGVAGVGRMAVTNGGVITAPTIDVSTGAANILAGDGEIQAQITSDGVISPGSTEDGLDAHGVLTLTGAVALEPDSVVRIELAGPATHDRLVVNGDLSLGGDLQIDLLDDFVPTAGDTFVIVEAGLLSGSWMLEAPALPDGLVWSLVECDSGVVLIADDAGAPVADCNDNGVADICEILNGTAEDCDENGVPDECQLSGAVFADAASWSVFSAADAGVGDDPTGFYGTVFDGRYVYFVPRRNTTMRHGEVLRYDTLDAFEDPEAWEAFSAAEAGLGVDPVGYIGGTFDGRYVYFAPDARGEQASDDHGEVLRYDTAAPFDAATSWSVFNLETEIDAGLVGFAGATFDGRYVYLAPRSSAAAVRYDTLADFASADAWETYEVGANNDYRTAVHDGSFVYFVSYDHGVVARYDPDASFDDPAAWSSFDPGSAIFGGDYEDGHLGAVVEDGRIILTPTLNGHFLQYDTSGPFDSLDSWSTFDAAGVGGQTEGYAGGVAVNGWMYFAPSHNGTSYHSEVLRLETTGAFTNPASWSAFDPGAAGVGPDADGFIGAVTDGRFVYFGPWTNGDFHGQVLRFDSSGGDCNGNGVLDSCDIASGESSDNNGNGIPDECEGFFYIGPPGGSWFDPANWSTGLLPGPRDDIIIGDAVVIDGPGATAGEVVVQAGGAITFQGGDAEFASLTIESGGAVLGDGFLVGDVVNGGWLSPGSPIGELTIDGAYTQLAAGVLQIDIGGENPGVSADRLNVTMTATLGGELLVNLAAPFTPASGFCHQYLLAGVVASDYATVTPPSPAPQYISMASLLTETTGGVCFLTDPFLCTAGELGPQSEASDGLGSVIAVDGDVLVVGAFADGTSGPLSGLVYVYRFDGLNWMLETVLAAPDAQAGDRFGAAAAVNAGRLLIGAPREDEQGFDAGAAYLFEFDGVEWTFVEKLTAVDAASNDRFGAAVALESDVIVIGAPGDDDVAFDAGAAYVFREFGSAWFTEAKLTDGLLGGGAAFGSTVLVSGDDALVGAPGAAAGGVAGAGLVFEFMFDGLDWIATAALEATTPEADAGLGASLAWTADVLVAGAPGSGSGSAVVFVEDGGGWVESTVLASSDGAADDGFGSAVAVSDELLIIGAPRADNASADTGAIYTFTWLEGIWTESNRLAIDGLQAGERFGASAAIHATGAVSGTDAFSVGLPGRVFTYLGLDIEDCDGDLIPDDCDLVANPDLDCNGNGAPDSCDIADGTSEDVNGDGVPDECAVLGDLNGDGVVNAGDLAILLAAWGPCSDCPADLDGDGVVGAADLAALLANWGSP